MDAKKTPFEVEMTPDMAQGIYANSVFIGHLASEFVLDFARIVPGTKKARVHSRIIMTPQNVLLLKNALDENLKRYEKHFGTIKIFGKTQKEIGFK
ncbi:hypothetical protein AMJ87_07940 [candidate division WOR_3 bacterium SM23_60]|uniref:DUF3467 domain-containing protein n=1 Tax=candidate division WOR_3 bacterium SM23_60 TaxID=1703780 RepID=A0A0S8GDA3_UNCW3|nr:MAG: hypothetical protein AMJ87_07940 [candidate division WOR_3 bacterium SM23_60]